MSGIEVVGESFVLTDTSGSESSQSERKKDMDAVMDIIGHTGRLHLVNYKTYKGEGIIGCYSRNMGMAMAAANKFFSGEKGFRILHITRPKEDRKKSTRKKRN